MEECDVDKNSPPRDSTAVHRYERAALPGTAAVMQRASEEFFSSARLPFNQNGRVVLRDFLDLREDA